MKIPMQNLFIKNRGREPANKTDHELIWDLCGKVATYSQIAALAGNCNLRRYVGNALHKNPSNAVTPCHRVVNAKGFCSGSFAFGGPGVQQEKLEAEGVIFVDGHVDMERFDITPDDFEMMSSSLF